MDVLYGLWFGLFLGFLRIMSKIKHGLNIFWSVFVWSVTSMNSYEFIEFSLFGGRR